MKNIERKDYMNRLKITFKKLSKTSFKKMCWCATNGGMKNIFTKQQRFFLTPLAQ